MTKFLSAGAAVLLIAAIAVPAMAEGPRASSENHWPGMQIAEPAPQYALSSPPQYAAGPPARYVWEQGYDHGGKWRGHWTLVQ